MLKSQLDSLKSAAQALQDESLFNSRSVQIKTENSGLTANASTGAITGSFSIEVESLASPTEISSKNRTSQKLAEARLICLINLVICHFTLLLLLELSLFPAKLTRLTQQTLPFKS